MNFLIIDGNSIVNRAFYGIKLLNAKDGHFTNALFGFMNIFMSLTENYHPEAVAVAFDVHQPTFRHKMYDGYKAGRKGMPPELFEQMEPLKKLLSAYGCHIVECPGYEADDILGTLSAATPAQDHCYIATGDRDSLQLVKDNVTVLLTSTKMGRTQTVEYTPEKIMEEYGVVPSGMIELKALQGDSSDNIPGVAGVGPKTAGDLIKKYKTIDYIYDHIHEIETTAGVRNKLIADRDNAFFSRQLGTICLEAPIDVCTDHYVLNPRDDAALLKELSYHEMFKLIDRLQLHPSAGTVAEEAAPAAAGGKTLWPLTEEAIDQMTSSGEPLYCYAQWQDGVPSVFLLCRGDEIYYADFSDLFTEQSLFRLLENAAVPKYVNDAKPLFTYALQRGRTVANVAFDLSLAAYILDPNASEYGAEQLALSYRVPLTPPEAAEESSAAFLEENGAAAQLAAAFPILCGRLAAQIAERDETKLLTEMEIPLAEVLADMELAGIRVNEADIRAYSEKLTALISSLETEIHEAAGEVFNINSPKQLGVILFEKLGIPAKKKTKTGYSTNAEVLEALADDYPIVSKILEYRTYSKLKSTYCDGLLAAVDADGRVRCTFNQKETRTGRLSSTEPNLQNIPVRTEVGREFRKFFVAEPGRVIVDADYSQIELRVLADLANDENMLNAFNSGTDIHAVTAAKVFGVPLENVTSELRSKAKAVNFGIVYGIGAFSLSKNIHSTRQEAESFISAYLSLYGGIDRFMKECIDRAKERGYAETIFNRRRYLPELTSSNHMIRSFGERVARNMPIQGTAADIIKIAMINVYRRLKQDYPAARLIMQVHDELMVECPEQDAEAMTALVKEEMENAVRLKVKLSVDAHAGRSWYEAKG